MFDGKPAGWWRGIRIEWTAFYGNVLPWFGDIWCVFLVDEALVGMHFGRVLCKSMYLQPRIGYSEIEFVNHEHVRKYRLSTTKNQEAWPFKPHNNNTHLSNIQTQMSVILNGTTVSTTPHGREAKMIRTNRHIAGPNWIKGRLTF